MTQGFAAPRAVESRPVGAALLDRRTTFSPPGTNYTRFRSGPAIFLCGFALWRDREALLLAFVRDGQADVIDADIAAGVHDPDGRAVRGIAVPHHQHLVGAAAAGPQVAELEEQIAVVVHLGVVDGDPVVAVDVDDDVLVVRFQFVERPGL